jgi:hypothetical protein
MSTTTFSLESLQEVVRLLADRPHLTHVLIARSQDGQQVTSTGRFDFSAASLYHHLRWHKRCAGGTLGPAVHFDDPVGDHHAEVRDLVEAMLGELRQRPDVRFVLAYHIEGDEEVHLGHSGHLTRAGALDAIREQLAYGA